uniref:MBD domain-containing protein n=1 Tax=Salix viminalis TaxID=40686 RepID=A0A6N2NJB8_SALVM
MGPKGKRRKRKKEALEKLYNDLPQSCQLGMQFTRRRVLLFVRIVLKTPLEKQSLFLERDEFWNFREREKLKKAENVQWCDIQRKKEVRSDGERRLWKQSTADEEHDRGSRAKERGVKKKEHLFLAARESHELESRTKQSVASKSRAPIQLMMDVDPLTTNKKLYCMTAVDRPSAHQKMWALFDHRKKGFSNYFRGKAPRKQLATKDNGQLIINTNFGNSMISYPTFLDEESIYLYMLRMIMLNWIMNPRVAPRSIDKYTVQCDKCSKWRVISTVEEYEEIRSKMRETPYVCDRKSGISCDDPADIEYNATRTWAIDRPAFSRPRRIDANYIAPSGKKLRTLNEIAAFIEANPKYQDVKLSDFSFTSPKTPLRRFHVLQINQGKAPRKQLATKDQHIISNRDDRIHELHRDQLINILYNATNAQMEGDFDCREYEEIRSKMRETPYVCDRKSGISCDDPADIEYNATRTWPLIDLHSQDPRRIDANYIAPSGKKLRTLNEIAAFIEANPKYQDVKLSDFSFTSPKVMEETVQQLCTHSHIHCGRDVYRPCVAAASSTVSTKKSKLALNPKNILTRHLFVDSMSCKSTRGKAPRKQLATKNPRVAPRSIDKYIVQCDKCSKWRVISTVEEYEEIRSKMRETPYVCDRKSGISCDDPADIEYNATRTWPLIDLHSQDPRRIDANYIAPSGKKLRTLMNSSIIEANPKYQDVKLSDFSFTSQRGKAPRKQLATKDQHIISNRDDRIHELHRDQLINILYNATNAQNGGDFDCKVEIRSKMRETPYVCDRKSGISCDDPADIEYNALELGPLIDLHSQDPRRIDANYIAPSGKKLRTLNEIAAFIEANPKYQDVKLSDFSFTSPKVMEETVQQLCTHSHIHCGRDVYRPCVAAASSTVSTKKSKLALNPKNILTRHLFVDSMSCKSTRGKAPRKQLATKNPRVAPRSIDKYIVQCDKCSKWRVISTVEEYEEIRSKMRETPYVCDRKSGISCDDPADIEYNATRTWAIDRPGILKTPEGFKRSLELRRDFSRIDANYIAPSGKKLRTLNEIAAFIEANPNTKTLTSVYFPKVWKRLFSNCAHTHIFTVTRCLSPVRRSCVVTMLTISPSGKKLRTLNEIAAFIEANPKYQDVKLSDFSFTSPKVMEDTIPEDVS